jgi:hypothetical protein
VPAFPSPVLATVVLVLAVREPLVYEKSNELVEMLVTVAVTDPPRVTFSPT